MRVDGLVGRRRVVAGGLGSGLKSIANSPDIVEGMSREEIDAAIAQHADTELLSDQPYEDKRKMGVPEVFTVETLAPHLAVAAEPVERVGDGRRVRAGCGVVVRAGAAGESADVGGAVGA